MMSTLAAAAAIAYINKGALVFDPCRLVRQVKEFDRL